MGFLKTIKEAVSNLLWPDRERFNRQSTAALDEKLKGLDWKETEDPETIEKLAKASEVKGDALAGVVFTGRPQNPFGKDT